MSSLEDYNAPKPERVLTPHETEMATLVDTWESIKAQIDDLYGHKNRLEAAMAAAMRAEKASEFPHGKLFVTYKPEKLWVDGLLVDLKEQLIERGLDPEEYLSKPVERKFDKRKLTKLAKQGGKVKEIIESAQTVSEPLLKVKKS